MLFHTMFNESGFEKIVAWKGLRDKIEFSANPLKECAEVWGMAPLVNRVLDPRRPDTWPDPWTLLIENKFDNLAIAVGMMNTLKLTNRFKDEEYQIYVCYDRKELEYYLQVGNHSVLNLEYKEVSTPAEMQKKQVQRIYPEVDENV